MESLNVIKTAVTRWGYLMVPHVNVVEKNTE